MGIHDFLGGVEAKPCSGISAPRTILRMVEGLEQVRDLFLGYSDSLIGDLHENLPDRERNTYKETRYLSPLLVWIVQGWETIGSSRDWATLRSARDFSLSSPGKISS